MADSMTDKAAAAPEDADAYLEQIKRWYKADVKKATEWRKEAEEDFRFRDGDQWSEDEKKQLAAQARPTLVFNRTGVLVDAVVGSEVQNRREVRYIPREQGDAKGNEVLSAAAEWFRDLCDAEDEETEAFKDVVTAGMGWTETRLDYSENPDGEPKIEHLDPFEMVWDADCVSANLVGSRRRWRVRQMSLKDAQELFPGVDEADLNAAWANDTEEDAEPGSNDQEFRYLGEDEGDEKEPSRKVTIVACQYVKPEKYYRALVMAPPQVGPGGMPMMQPPAMQELSEAEYQQATASGMVVKAVPLTRKTVYQCFLGRVVLKEPEPTQTGMFTWQCMTGLVDKDRGSFYGIVRRAKDPQRWANKWLSQMMHILNSQAKGGIMAEEGAFENVRDAEANWTRPDAITKLAKGALTGQNGPKIQPKPVAQFPAGFDRLLQYADEAIIKATGINMELLGMRDANQPGVLEYQRKQSGITILAPFFDGLRRYRKLQGRVMLKLIQDFLTDDRLIRVVGQEKTEYVPLSRAGTADVEYDIIVDDAPSSPNEKEKTWQILQSLLPILKDTIGPREGLMLAEYSPLPPSLVEKLKKSAQEAEQQQAQPDPMQQAALAIEAQKMQIEAQKLANEQQKMQLEMVKLQVEAKKLDVEMRKAQADETVAMLDANVAIAQAQQPVVQQVRPA